MSHSNVKHGILRYGWWTRVNHWLIAISFTLLVLSGLALFYPFFFGLTSLFGGPEPTRIVHPYIGVFMSLFFIIQAVRFFGDNLFRRHDVQWMKQIRDVLGNRDERLPPVGKNNAGQKLVYWIFLATVPILLVTGIVLWRPWIADDMPVWALRWAVTIHAYTAFIAIITLVIHIYSAIWVKGSVRAMTQGRVSHAWARHHHGLWYDEVRRKEGYDDPGGLSPDRDVPSKRT
ncbi:formate dehydrogenase subunit gamma [Stutzerimonas zhaodongensis]|uniref:Formate dehydrogenase subunit gamma n=1 Tax=Stutzerimonas zhaodongensis TaxID=1176257 RepID=A0A3M2HLC7_9GAMM|nr:formate dehydrogenase subunit gamma [Stutzerimonas zhaodongensis]MCQ2028972.1 formate dehydrogenase subunit gamma [Stutzerimonas zhaodongensis]MCQ4316039.1 formate dehydrogenase subunit gamma [Stutzerimonas zhaodongensis]RMH89155.1 formate dehydrogenase subunit gamma [Stutzerimonas zhaodongensis]